MPAFTLQVDAQAREVKIDGQKTSSLSVAGALPGSPSVRLEFRLSRLPIESDCTGACSIAWSNTGSKKP